MLDRKEGDPYGDCNPTEFDISTISSQHQGTYEGTHIIKVDVYSTEMGQDKVSYCIRTLNGFRVAVEGIEEPWILGGDEIARLLIGP